MNKNKLGICVIGSGRAGRIHMNNFAFRIPSAKLVAVVDPVEAAAVSAAKVDLPAGERPDRTLDSEQGAA